MLTPDNPYGVDWQPVRPAPLWRRRGHGGVGACLPRVHGMSGPSYPYWVVRMKVAVDQNAYWCDYIKTFSAGLPPTAYTTRPRQGPRGKPVLRVLADVAPSLRGVE